MSTIDASDTTLGVDYDVTLDLDPSFVLTSGLDNLAKAILRRLSTPRGWMANYFDDDPDYGLDVRGFLNSGMTTAQIGAIQGQITDEVLKDDRVHKADVTATFSLAATTLTVEISMDTALGPFDLVLGISSLTVAILNGGEVQQAVTAAPAAPAPAPVTGERGPAGPAGAPGTSGGAATLGFTENRQFSSSTGSEELVVESLEDFDSLTGGATLNVSFEAQVKSSTGTATFKIYIGGSDDTVSGTLVVTMTTSSASFASVKATGTITNPGGLKLVKITAQSSGAGNDAFIKGAQVVIK